MFTMIDYVRDMTVKKACMVSMDCLSICSSCELQAAVHTVSHWYSDLLQNVDICVCSCCIRIIDVNVLSPFDTWLLHQILKMFKKKYSRQFCLDQGLDRVGFLSWLNACWCRLGLYTQS